MAQSEVRWLLRELPGLVAGQVLSEDAAERLERHYSAKPGRAKPVALMVFGVLGALLVGAGIILLLAHNWEALSRPLRTVLSLAPLVLSQVLAGFVLLRQPGSAAWREGSATLLTLSIGSCLALIGQTYHLPYDPSNLVLTWTLLLLPVVYLLDSRVAAAGIWVGATVWLFHAPWGALASWRVLGFAALAGASLPYLVLLARRHRDEVRLALLLWVVVGCLLASSGRLLSDMPSALWFVLLAGLVGTLHGVGATAFDGPRAVWRHPLLSSGALGAGVLALTLSYRGTWEWIYEIGWTGDLFTGSAAVHPIPGVVLGVGLALVATALPLGFRLLRQGRWHEAGFALIPVPVAAGMALSHLGMSATAPAVLFNLYGMALGVLAFLGGLSRERLGVANAGLLLAASFLAARFFDAEWSFVVRGVGFVALGVAFLGVNVWMHSRRDREVAA